MATDRGVEPDGTGMRKSLGGGAGKAYNFVQNPGAIKDVLRHHPPSWTGRFGFTQEESNHGAFQRRNPS